MQCITIQYNIIQYSNIQYNAMKYNTMQCNTIQVSLIPPWEDQCEWHRMTRMTGPDCAVMCNLINIHTYIHTYILSHVSVPESYDSSTLMHTAQPE